MPWPSAQAGAKADSARCRSTENRSSIAVVPVRPRVLAYVLQPRPESCGGWHAQLGVVIQEAAEREISSSSVRRVGVGSTAEGAGASEGAIGVSISPCARQPGEKSGSHAHWTVGPTNYRPVVSVSAITQSNRPRAVRGPGATVSDRHRMERRSPTGIARERETRPNNAAPHQSPGCERRIATRAESRGHGALASSPGGGLRPASRGSAKPAPMTVRRTDVSGAPPAQSGLRRSPRCAGRCRQRSRPCLCVACAQSAVPTRGRRSLAGASWCPWGYPPRCVARRLASRSEGERGAVAPLSHFPPDHAGSERSSLPLFLRARQYATTEMERRSPTGIARERETRPNNAAPRQSHRCERRIAPAQNHGDMERRPVLPVGASDRHRAGARNQRR